MRSKGECLEIRGTKTEAVIAVVWEGCRVGGGAESWKVLTKQSVQSVWRRFSRDAVVD